VHNWDISRQIVSNVDRPVYLAGGISAENVRQAIRHVKPYGIDLCSSVRTNDKLDPVKLARFFEAVNNL
jgi:phosphoribosylanthranilate isomerase